MPARPRTEPIGLRVARTAKALNRAFDDALGEAGGTLPTWLVLLALRTGEHRTQRELAEAVGIRGATLSHHLDALEADGLITRRRDPANRRVQVVELTEAGDAAFHRLRAAAAGFDRRLRAGISDDELAQVRDVLARLAANAEGGRSAS